MFERYTDAARRALFCSRYEVTQLGGTAIEPEHLLLGVLRAAPPAIMRFARAGVTSESLRRALQPAAGSGEKVSTSVEIPFSADCKRALAQTAVEADAATNSWIGPEHIVLGVMVKTDGVAAHVLHEAGVRVDAIRDDLASRRDAPRDGLPQSTDARVPAPGMISRHWTGVVKGGRENDYLTHLRRETLPVLFELDGFVTVQILKREIEDGTEFEVITVWRSLDAIKRFAGEDVTVAVVPPAAQALLVRCDARAVHYEIVQ